MVTLSLLMVACYRGLDEFLCWLFIGGYREVGKNQIVDELMKHIPLGELMMTDCKHYGKQMIKNHSMDRLLKEVLMIELVMYTVKNDMVIHTEKAGMMRLVVEIEYVGKIADVFDKATWSFDGLQPEKVDLKFIHALNEPHLHNIGVVPNRHEVDKHLSCADPLLT
nr:hypothetical protein [Tanacetum cinerariifolium]